MNQVDDKRGRGEPAGRILLAEANSEAREYITRLLTGRWAITSVADGRAALQAAHERSPDLVICDVTTPGLDGMELLRALRADPLRARIPVVLLSSRAGEESRSEALEVSGPPNGLPESRPSSWPSAGAKCSSSSGSISTRWSRGWNRPFAAPWAKR